MYNYSKYTKNFFKELNTPEKCYIYGFILADGNVAKNENTVSVELEKEDVDILEKIKDEMVLENPIYFRSRNNSNSAILRFTNKSIKDDLVKHGCTPNKTFVVKPKLFNRKPLKHSFLRGYFDGDGAIYKRSRTNSWRISIRGTTNMLDYYKQTFNIPSSVRERKTVPELQSESQEVIKNTLTGLYKSSTIHLDRKFKLAKQII